MLKNYLTSYRFDSPHIVIGLFDRDTQGIKSFELSKNFVLDVSGLFKKSKNNKAFALLLPAIESKKEFIKFKNFCIEFMFDEPYLSMQVEGKGLELKDGITVEQFNGVTISCKPSDDLWFKTIEPSSKNYFSEKVVPTLPPEAFENFKHIFAIIEKIIKTKEK